MVRLEHEGHDAEMYMAITILLHSLWRIAQIRLWLRALLKQQLLTFEVGQVFIDGSLWQLMLMEYFIG
jgi:hypothetical protein